MKKLIILTGASGAGKTTITKHLKSLFKDTTTTFLHFDSIGVPPTTEMRNKFGSQENWQKETTFKWMKKIKTEYLDTANVVFEGQSRIEFLKSAIAENDINNFNILLVDCNDADRFDRLTQGRNQPELANQQMCDWAEFLRREAKAENCKILDTSLNSLSDCARHVKSILEQD